MLSTAPAWRAFLSIGFRPLYLAGASWAAIAIAIWVFAPHWLSAPLAGVAWHAHEMLWGFIATIAVGFLLTAGANWTGINPVNNIALAALSGCWLLARVGFFIGGGPAFLVAVVAEVLFFIGAAGAMAHVVMLSKNQRNYGVPFMLIGLALADAAFLYATWSLDYLASMRYLSAGLLVMCIIAILVARRVIPFFAVRVVANLNPRTDSWSGYVQMAAAALAIVALLFAQSLVAAVLLALTGALALVQLIGWRPWSVRHKPLLWILYLGYAGLGIGLLAASLHMAGRSLSAALHVHLIAMAGFSVLIIGMITRTALGHLGRPMVLDRSMLVSYVLLLTAVVLRVVAFWADSASQVIVYAAAAAWIGAFATYLWRFVPWLIRPRAD